MSKVLSILTTAATVVIIGGSVVYANYQNQQLWERPCDGKEITASCTADDGVKYSKYIFHDAEPEKTKQVEHPAEAAVTHKVHHDAVYGIRKIPTGCIKTNISYKYGTCALSRCRDGKYSGSTGWGTCNYHGGVWYGGGPWYTYREESYVVKPAWDETVVDIPAKPAWTETIIIAPAKEAYWEKVKAE